MAQASQDHPERPGPPRDWAELIGRWPSPKDLAADLALPRVTIRMWKSRNTIPSENFCAVVEAAQYRGFHEITYRVMCEIAERMASRRR